MAKNDGFLTQRKRQKREKKTLRDLREDEYKSGFTKGYRKRKRLRDVKRLVKSLEDKIDKAETQEDLDKIDFSDTRLGEKNRRKLTEKLAEKTGDLKEAKEKMQKDKEKGEKAKKKADKSLDREYTAKDGKQILSNIGKTFTDLLNPFNIPDFGRKWISFFKGEHRIKKDWSVMGIAKRFIKWATPKVIIFLLFYIFMMWITVICGGFIGIMLSHPAAIRSLYTGGCSESSGLSLGREVTGAKSSTNKCRNLLGDAMFLGNVTEDVYDKTGEILLVKGNPKAQPGCFVYDGETYCGAQCNVVGDSNGNKTEKVSNNVTTKKSRYIQPVEKPAVEGDSKARGRAIPEDKDAKVLDFGGTTPKKIKYTDSDIKLHGVIRADGREYTYYSEDKLNGGGLSIPGRHNKDGFVVDENDYIVGASSMGPDGKDDVGTLYRTSFGLVKIYDKNGSPRSTEHIDLYTASENNPGY